MFRLLFLIVLLAAAFVLIESRWAPETRTLTLRVRTGAELVRGVQEAARALGDRAAERIAGDSREPPPVAAPPPERGAQRAAPASSETPGSELHSDEERARLHRLVEEKTREP